MEVQPELMNENPLNNNNPSVYNSERTERKEKKREKTLAEIENDVKKKWEEIKNCPKEDVDIAEKFYSENSTILYVPTSIKCEGIDDIIRVHSYQNHYGISTKDLSNEVIINTTVCGNTITEEKILTILHSRPIQWLLPGVQATGRRIVLPIVTIVSFDDDLYIKSKRLYWDQACVLKQVGLIPTISRCPFNGEDTEVPVKGVQQSDPLLSREQLEDINSLDILNRYSLKRASIERFKDLRSDYVNKNKNDSVKKLFEEDGHGVDELVEYDGRRRSYNTIDFKNKSDTLSGFVSGGIKEEYTRNEKITNKNYNKDKNESKNINEILSENNTDAASNQCSNSTSSKTRRMFKEHLYKNDNVFSNSSGSNTTVYSGKRIFADKNKDNVKISMDKSDTESECTDLYSTMYDISNVSNVDGKWDNQSNQSRQTISRDETLTDVSNMDYQTDLINEQMKNLCLKNNYVNDTNNNGNINEGENNSVKHEKKMRKHRAPNIAPHFISNITFDYYGNQDIYEKSKYRRRRKMVPRSRSTFKIAYDKEELERDYKRSNKPISPTYVSHVFDNEEIVRKERPVHKNSVFYDSICFDNYGPQKVEYKPPLIIRDKYISNIFAESPVEEVYKRHRKSNPNIENELTSSSFSLDGSMKEAKRPYYGPYKGQEDHMNRVFAEPSIDSLVHPVVKPIPKNSMHYTTFRFDDPPESPVISSVPKDKYVSTIFRGESLDMENGNVTSPSPSSVPKDKYVSTIFRGESLDMENGHTTSPSIVPKDKYISTIFRGESLDMENVPTINVNDASSRAGIYSKLYFNLPRGIKTKYDKVDHVNEIFSGTNEKLNFNDIRTINNIHNSMHQPQRQAQAQRV